MVIGHAPDSDDRWYIYSAMVHELMGRMVVYVEEEPWHTSAGRSLTGEWLMVDRYAEDVPQYAYGEKIDEVMEWVGRNGWISLTSYDLHWWDIRCGVTNPDIKQTEYAEVKAYESISKGIVTAVLRAAGATVHTGEGWG